MSRPELQSLESALGTPFRFYYDLHGIVTIGSDVVLPELAYFRSPTGSATAPAPDIGHPDRQGGSPPGADPHGAVR